MTKYAKDFEIEEFDEYNWILLIIDGAIIKTYDLDKSEIEHLIAVLKEAITS